VLGGIAQREDRLSNINISNINPKLSSYLFKGRPTAPSDDMARVRKYPLKQQRTTHATHPNIVLATEPHDLSRCCTNPKL
jgi:hypothetical protein